MKTLTLPGLGRLRRGLVESTRLSSRARSIRKSRWYLVYARPLHGLVHKLLSAPTGPPPVTSDIKHLHVLCAVDQRKPRIALPRDRREQPYWEKFRTLLAESEIPYEVFDVNVAGWIDVCRRCDALVWAMPADPCGLKEAQRKLLFVQDVLGKPTFPSHRSALIYEDKILQSYLFRQCDIPTPSTFVSFDENDCLAHAESATYPLVWKLTTGSGSAGVELVASSASCRRMIKRVFSPCGRRTYWPYLNQQGYVYLQELIPGKPRDTRIIVIGDYLWGYHREVLSNDFRASGMGGIIKTGLPSEALELAWRTKEELGLHCVAVDMVRTAEGGYLVIEASPFIQVDTPEQLVIDGRPGYLVRHNEGSYAFVEGRYWIQEFMLADFLKRSFDLIVEPSSG